MDVAHYCDSWFVELRTSCVCVDCECGGMDCGPGVVCDACMHIVVIVGVIAGVALVLWTR